MLALAIITTVLLATSMPADLRRCPPEAAYVFGLMLRYVTILATIWILYAN